MTFEPMWAKLEPVGRLKSTGGYGRFAWTSIDSTLRHWFKSEAESRGLDVVADRAGNLWAWWGNPDSSTPGVVVGSHLDSVPDGGAFDGPLGVVSAFVAVDRLRARNLQPAVPVGIACLADEEGARFGVACAGSRLVTGALRADRALALRDGDGLSLAEAMAASGHNPRDVGPDPEALGRVGVFVELHVEQGRGLARLGYPVAVGSSIWPHGRWRFDLAGEANHAGTTPLADRRDPMLDLAQLVLTARTSASTAGCVATIGKVRVEPNGVNAIPSRVCAWLDARGPIEGEVRSVARAIATAVGSDAVEESFTAETHFDLALVTRLAKLLGDVPVLGTGAGHDAGIFSQAGIPSVMLFVRNPTGVSHSPAEHAEIADCLAGIDALTRVLEDLVG